MATYVLPCPKCGNMLRAYSDYGRDTIVNHAHADQPRVACPNVRSDCCDFSFEPDPDMLTLDYIWMERQRVLILDRPDAGPAPRQLSPAPAPRRRRRVRPVFFSPEVSPPTVVGPASQGGAGLATQGPEPQFDARGRLRRAIDDAVRDIVSRSGTAPQEGEAEPTDAYVSCSPQSYIRAAASWSDAVNSAPVADMMAISSASLRHASMLSMQNVLSWHEQYSCDLPASVFTMPAEWRDREVTPPSPPAEPEGPPQA